MAQRRRAAGLLAILVVAGALGACRPAQPISVSWSVDERTATAGADAIVTVEIGSSLGGATATKATLSLEGHMTHPGMAPVVASMMEVAPGRYQAPLPLAMAGEWILVLTGTLADGSRVQAEHHVEVTGATAPD